jgi:hypothetical protein
MSSLSPKRASCPIVGSEPTDPPTVLVSLALKVPKTRGPVHGMSSSRGDRRPDQRVTTWVIQLKKEHSHRLH